MLFYRSALKKSRFQRISGEDCWRITKGWKEHCDYNIWWCDDRVGGWIFWFVSQECQLCFREIFQQINKTFRSKIWWLKHTRKIKCMIGQRPWRWCHWQGFGEVKIRNGGNILYCKCWGKNDFKNSGHLLDRSQSHLYFAPQESWLD